MAFDHGAAFRAFRKTTECLDRNFAGKYFLIDGTLLGYARSGGFIPGDYDVDFGMFIEDYSPQILEDFKAAGFKHTSTLGTIESGYQLKFKYGKVRIDLVFYYREEDRIWNIVFPKAARYRAVYPRFDLSPVEFLGARVMAPSPPEAYLAAVYGPDWRRPVQRWNYKYMCHNFEDLNGPVIRGIYWLRNKIWHWKNPDPYLRRDGTRPKLVYTEGVFDLFHANHSLLLKEARAHGDSLVVGVVSDRMAASYKRRPIIPERERLQIVQDHKSVDCAFILDGPVDSSTFDKALRDWRPDVVVYAGGGQGRFDDYFRTAIEGGFYVDLPYHDGTSTSQIVARIRGTDKARD
ncbi:MAG TPA: hypothetical protein ENJ52_14605 [Aliiroseovarius sp.]|nr:hypothetical protein [Aliiroseovarius sp.]